MRLLAIETATEACSAALWVNGEIIERYQFAPRRHNELILPMCEQVLSQAQLNLSGLDAIAFGCGPGAFTGVRIAASVAQAIALAHDLPVVPVSTLANLAFQAEVNPGELILPAIDARMDEIYWAVYKKNPVMQLELVKEEKSTGATAGNRPVRRRHCLWSGQRLENLWESIDSGNACQNDQ